MKALIIAKLFIVTLFLFFMTACASVSIQEHDFLRDRQQAVLYHLTRFGASTNDDIAERTYYSVEAIARSLKKLEEKQLVKFDAMHWSITSSYRQEAAEYVDAIETFSLQGIQDETPEHLFTISKPFESGTQMASFVSASATETLVIFPGNGFNLIPDAAELKKLIAPNRNVFVMEYPGMGDSQGELTINTLRSAANQFFRHVEQLSVVNNTTLIVYGFSLGGFLATEIASSYKVDALILDSTAPDMQSWIDANVPLYAKAFVNIEIDANLKKVSNIKPMRSLTSPILFIVGSNDEITPPGLIKEIYQAAEHAAFKEFSILKGVQHGESLDHAEFQATITQFIKRVRSKGVTHKSV